MEQKEKELVLDFMNKAGAGEVPDRYKLSSEYSYEEISILLPYLIEYYRGKEEIKMTLLDIQKD